MAKQSPRTTYLKDYTAPPYLIDSIDLSFELEETATSVRSRLHLRRNPDEKATERPLILDGRSLELRAISLDGQPLAKGRYSVDDEHLIVAEVPERFSLEIETVVNPQANTSLEGLYTSSGNFCTQCEAEGFRKITFYIDRPDVMARFSTTIKADRDRYPVLLSNGNLVQSGVGDDGKHWVRWEDPFPKPSYLFALVAGDLRSVEDVFVTRSGREIALRIFVEPHNIDKCAHAMQSLRKAMKWDEEVYGLEYDLDNFMIVAVDDFNMGAMENKGLNIFNSKYVLARPETATDADYAAIESVIAHEYFHNWTGNRVTCRDWFQLSLKEGLTVFRDQEFSADVSSRPVTRINDVRVLRTSQFSEDAGPMAHPVRPSSYIEISNFYTVTVYNKGAELIRMVHTLLGGEGFRRGMDLYFERHDGDAVTIDHFLQAMQDATTVDLTQFKQWYEQAGTPRLELEGSYDERARTYTLTTHQSCPPTPGQPRKKPFHIPLSLALLDADGTQMPLRLRGEPPEAAAGTRVLSCTRKRDQFCFEDIDEHPVPSVLRNFSAPVKTTMQRSTEELAFLFARDTDPFNRWDAGQTLATDLILSLVDSQRNERRLELDESFVTAMAHTLTDPELDKALIAEAISLPTEGYLAEQMEVVDVDAIHVARNFVQSTLGQRLREALETTYQENLSNERYAFEPVSGGRRRLKNLALEYLMALRDKEYLERCLAQFHNADNMTDMLAAFRILVNTRCTQRRTVIDEFIERWADDSLVTDKWFTTQATSQLPGTLGEVKELLGHEAFNLRNPNKVRALIGAFCYGNQVRFHDQGGEGYQFLADRVLELDPLNPQVAARLLGALSRWRQFDKTRQELMQMELERILATPKISRDVYEIASKTLG